MSRASQPNARQPHAHLARLSKGGTLRAAALACAAAGAIAALVPGCSAGREEIALGSGSYSFVSGEFLASAEGRPAEFAERAQAVLAQRAQGVTVRSRPTWSHVRGTLPDGREVVIFATRAAAGAAASTPGDGTASGASGVSGSAEDRLVVSIRVGPLGDEAESVRLIEAIRARGPRSGDPARGAPAPAAPPTGSR